MPVFSQTAYIKSARPMHDAHFGMFGLALSGQGTTLVAGESGAVTVYERNPSWRVTADLVPSPSPLDLGPRVAISDDGQTIAVGGADADAVGAIYVFRRTGETWTQEAHIRDVDDLGSPVVNGSFPASLALSADGNSLVVGSQDASTDAGRIRTFDRSDAGWSQVASFGGGSDDYQLGVRLALAPEGDVLVATVQRGGTPLVEVYTRTGTSWLLRSALPAMTRTVSNGTNIACSSMCRTIAIGVIEEEPMAPAGTGVVYLSSGDGTTWQPPISVRAMHSDPGDAFGTAVALSKDGSTLVVGAPRESGASTGINGDSTNNDSPYSGAAYVFRRTLYAWRQVMYLKASNADATDIMGSEVDVSNDGTTIVVAAPYEAGGGSGVDADSADNSAPYAGAVYAFEGTF